MELFGKHDQLGHQSKEDLEALYLSCKLLTNKIIKDLQICLSQRTVELVMKYIHQFIDVFEIEMASKESSKGKNYRLPIILLQAYREELDQFSKSLKECLKEFKSDKGKRNQILFRLKRELLVFVIDSEPRSPSSAKGMTSRRSPSSLRRMNFSIRTKIRMIGNCCWPTCR